MSAGQAVRHSRMADRLFALLDVFTPDRPRMTLSEISRETGLPLATVHRLAGHLVGWGALDRGDDGRYGIGLHLWEVACREHRALALREAAVPHVLRLRDETGSRVLVSVLDGADAVVIEHLPDAHQCGDGRRIGGREAAGETAGGRVLLAYQKGTEGLRPPLRRHLADVRRAGVAVIDGRPRDRMFAAAAPVRDKSRAVIAALSVVGISNGKDARVVMKALRETADAISQAIGGPPAPARTMGSSSPDPDLSSE